MPSQHRLEGTDLEALLERVQEEFDGATIVEANRLRRGGIGGFFAKETYEVVLDVPETPRPTRHALGRLELPAVADRPLLDDEKGLPRSTAPRPRRDVERDRGLARTRGARLTTIDDPGALADLDLDDLLSDSDGEDGFVPFTLDELATRVEDPAPVLAGRRAQRAGHDPEGHLGAGDADDEDDDGDDDDPGPSFEHALGEAITEQRAARRRLVEERAAAAAEAAEERTYEALIARARAVVASRRAGAVAEASTEAAGQPDGIDARPAPAPTRVAAAAGARPVAGGRATARARAYGAASGDGDTDDELAGTDPGRVVETALAGETPLPSPGHAGVGTEPTRPAVADAGWPAASALADAEPATRIRAPRVVPGDLDGLPVVAAPAVPAVPAVPAAPAAAVAPTVTRPDPADLTDLRDLTGLARLGLPVEALALPARTDDPASVALVRMLERLPAAPALPHRPGSPVLVLGDRRQALSLARELSLEMGIDAEDVLVAGRRKDADLRCVADAREARRSWRRRRGAVVIAVEAPFAVVPDDWTMAMVDAIEPVVAIGHVDASRKPEDVVAWSERLGGLDALAVHGLDATTTPAAVLATRIPVTRIDGLPATAARWAAVLTDRLVA